MEGIRLGTIRGIEIRLNWSVVVIASLIAYSLAESVLPDSTEGHSTTAYWATGVITALAFFAALIAHELGHSFVALNYGVEVKGITLWLLGGVAMLGSESPDAKAAMRIAAAGPAVSGFIGFTALAVSTGANGLAEGALIWFGAINVVLAGFNLLPAYPLDGGRIYQAWQWKRLGDDLLATQRAVKLGRNVGLIFMIVGTIEVLGGVPIGGIWLIFIGWFVREAAQSELRHKTIAEPLESLTAGQVMTRDPMTVEASMPLADFVTHILLEGRHAAYPVTEGERIVGVMNVKDLGRLQGGVIDGRVVRDAMCPIARVIIAEPGDPITELISKLDQQRDARALVVDGDDAVGIISPTDIARLLSLLQLMPASSRPNSESVTGGSH